MQSIKALYGNTIIDITMQALSDASRIIEVAQLNGLSITDDINAGDLIIVPVAALKKPQVKVTVVKAVKQPVIKVGYAQTLIDMAMQGSGDAAMLIEVAQIQGLSITDSITPGDYVTTPIPVEDKKKTAALLTIPFNNPASDDNILHQGPQGIGYWIIEKDFVVQ